MIAATQPSATERGGRAHSTGKRKLAVPESTRKAPARQHKSITEHFSSSQDTFEAEEPPRSPSKRSKSDHSPSTPDRHSSKAASDSLANMYSFPPSRAPPNGANAVVDLTGSSPASSPTSHPHNRPFA